MEWLKLAAMLAAVALIGAASSRPVRIGMVLQGIRVDGKTLTCHLRRNVKWHDA
jgi:ABC-type transport system substrate-binding protein